MLVFNIVSYISLYLGLAFCSLCLATGLYYLAELAEEYTVMTRKVLRIMFIVILGFHIMLLLFERISTMTVFFGILSHVVYYQFLREFPFFSMKSLKFILSVCCFLLSHVLWYWYFTDYRTPNYDFYQLLGFFFSCVWLLPGAFFITLSANDLSLPGSEFPIMNNNNNNNNNTINIINNTSSYSSTQKRKNIFAWVWHLIVDNFYNKTGNDR